MPQYKLLKLHNYIYLGCCYSADADITQGSLAAPLNKTYSKSSCLTGRLGCITTPRSVY